jgi:enoyl-CoA hydratase
VRPLSCDLVDGVLEVRLHRAPLNEIGMDMLCALEEVADVVRDGARGARAVIVSSDQRGGFCAGADLRELCESMRAIDAGDVASRARRVFDRRQAFTSALAGALQFSKRSNERSWRSLLTVIGVRAFLDRIHRVFDTFDASPVPTIAAVHGVCFGGGLELALTCDVIVADKTARFAFPELRLGLIPGFGGIPRLERDLGNAVVRDLLLSGRSLGAQRAHDVGLVAQLAGEGQAKNVARRLATQMSRFEPHTLRAAKRFAKRDVSDRMREEKAIFCELLTSPVVRESLEAFVRSSSAMPYLPERPSKYAGAEG